MYKREGKPLLLLENYCSYFPEQKSNREKPVQISNLQPRTSSGAKAGAMRDLERSVRDSKGLSFWSQ